MPNAGKILVSLILLTVLSLSGCYPALRQEARRPAEALDKVRFFYPTFRDDMRLESLISALKRNLRYFNSLNPEQIFHKLSDANDKIP